VETLKRHRCAGNVRSAQCLRHHRAGVSDRRRVLSAHQPKRRDYRHADIGCVLPDEVFNAMFPNAPGSIPLERAVVAAVRDDLAIGLQAQRPAGRLPRKRSLAMATCSETTSPTAPPDLSATVRHARHANAPRRGGLSRGVRLRFSEEVAKGRVALATSSTRLAVRRGPRNTPDQ